MEVNSMTRTPKDAGSLKANVIFAIELISISGKGKDGLPRVEAPTIGVPVLICD
jgi:hypothetical protein